MASYTVTRAANGQVIVSFKDMENHNVKGVGTMTGDATFAVGTTGESDESVFQVGNDAEAANLEFSADKTTDNFEFNGENINAEFKNESEQAYNVQWNAKDSTFDSSASNSSVIFVAGEESSNNLITLGDSANNVSGFDNLVSDSGKNNAYVAQGKSSNVFKTTAESVGALIQAGNAHNEFYLSGSYGVFSGGSADDLFVTDAASGEYNVMLGNAGSDRIFDYGSHSLFAGGAGYDYAKLFGEYGVFNLGFGEEGYVEYGSSADHSAAFTAETSNPDKDGKIYTYSEVLAMNQFELEAFLETSGLKDNPYLNLVLNGLKEAFNQQ